MKNAYGLLGFFLCVCVLFGCSSCDDSFVEGGDLMCSIRVQTISAKSLPPESDDEDLSTAEVVLFDVLLQHNKSYVIELFNGQNYQGLVGEETFSTIAIWREKNSEEREYLGGRYDISEKEANPVKGAGGESSLIQRRFIIRWTTNRGVLRSLQEHTELGLGISVVCRGKILFVDTEWDMGECNEAEH